MIDLESVQSVEQAMREIGTRARQAARILARADTAQKNAALTGAADRLRSDGGAVLAANELDVADAVRNGLTDAMVDRLRLDEQRLEGIASGLEQIAALPDPVGGVIAAWDRPNGLRIERVRVPLGVIGIIYESRPNVTADAGALCLKSGNAVVLRGGSESFRSNRAIGVCLADALETAGLPAASIQLVPTTDRAAVGALLGGLDGHVDVVVPRGGRRLIERVQRDARVPVIGHLEGLCHVYVDRAANADKARAIVVNSKLRRTGICGAAETLLIDTALDDKIAARIVADLVDEGCEVRGDPAAMALHPSVTPATDEDWRTEYLDAIISVRCVDGVDAAVEHLATYGSGHTESIVTEDTATADRFLDRVDSAIVLLNASTQFADGGEFGMGAEIGIATGRIHARGPVGCEQLTSYKYVVRGDGQVRP